MPTKACEQCGGTFDGKTASSRFCSRACIAKYTAEINMSRSKKVTCPVCGHRQYRTTELCMKCAGEKLPSYRGYVCDCGKPKSFTAKKCKDCHRPPWTEQEDDLIRTLYPKGGAKKALPFLVGRTHNQIRDRANRLGVVLTKRAYRKIVHDKAAEHMRQDNPSQRPGARQRLKRQARALHSNPEISHKMLKGSQKRQKGTPTKLEIKLFAILDELGIQYESHVIVKPNFIVDVRIGNVIIQADGDWWHGHPRFFPLMLRQHKQQVRDAAQDAYLEKCGYTVIRIWESDMFTSTVLDRLSSTKTLFQPPLLVAR